MPRTLRGGRQFARAAIQGFFFISVPSVIPS